MFCHGPGLLVLASAEGSSSLSWCDRHSDRSASGSSAALFTLVIVLHDLAHVSLALCLVRWSLDAVKRVWGLNKDRVVDDDLRICPASWESGSELAQGASHRRLILTSSKSHQRAPVPPC